MTKQPTRPRFQNGKNCQAVQEGRRPGKTVPFPIGPSQPWAALGGARLCEGASVSLVVLVCVSHQWHCSPLGPINHVSCALQDASGPTWPLPSSCVYCSPPTSTNCIINNVSPGGQQNLLHCELFASLNGLAKRSFHEAGSVGPRVVGTQ